MNSYLTKAETLENLLDKVDIFKIPELCYFSRKEFSKNTSNLLGKIQKKFCGPVVVRSSCLDEDGVNESFAGKYDSILNIDPVDTSSMHKAICIVIDSYKKDEANDNSQVIIQEMVRNTTMSGVIFTHDLNTGAPYYVINYDDQSGLTDTVTSGGGEYANRTLYIHRNSTNKLRSERFTKLLQAVQELEKVMGSQFLEANFLI